MNHFPFIRITNASDLKPMHDCEINFIIRPDNKSDFIIASENKKNYKAALRHIPIYSKQRMETNSLYRDIYDPITRINSKKLRGRYTYKLLHHFD